MRSNSAVAGVRILELPRAADKVYDYAVPEEMQSRIRVGSLAAVPFGAQKRRTALVVTLSDTSEYESLKPLTLLADDRYSLTPEQLGLCGFLCERTFCSTGEAVQTMIPGGALASLYHAKRDPVERFYRRTGAPLPKRLGSLERRALDLLACVEDAANDAGMPGMNGSHAASDLPTSSAARGGELSETALREAGISLATLKNLVSKGLISRRERELYRNPYAGRGRVTDANLLNPEQQAACDTLAALAASGEPKAALLHGITGSGKTRVIKALIDRVLESGRTAIMLVPEISLTSQTVDVFCGYFGERVAVIHSGLSDGERLDAHKRIRSGEVDVVIGTRSAVFAPLENLGLIVIDEEQEHTYKSDMNPKYHARDIARYRAAKSNALMLLASATPSLESYYKAKSGVYTLVTLHERYGGARLPEVVIADLRADTQKGNLSPIGSVLRAEIEKNLAAGEQTILFVGRRGYNNFVSCKMCGKAIECPHCSVSLTYHRDRDGERLKCHYCGFTQALPDRCPDCGSEHLDRKGFGTQLVAAELAESLPSARILRMDADVTTGKLSHEALLASFRAHEVDILIGTQMVTKGHDFPDVTLVGVINSDAALHLDDFRATERTFALLTQVIGRAGRGSKPGRAVLQTYSPENETILLSSRQDYEGFYSGAVRLRQQLIFPPFCDFVMLTVSGEDEPLVLDASLRLERRLRELLTVDFRELSVYIFGPMEAPVYRVNRVYRMRIIVKCAAGKRMRELMALLLSDFAHEKAVTVGEDVNPSSL